MTAAAVRRSRAALRRRELERKAAAAASVKQGRARAFYCRMHPCFACDSLGACAHREPALMAMPPEVLIREGRANRRKGAGG